jgi:hypothetical protein
MHNLTICSVCSHGDQHVYFNPTYSPREQWSEVWRFDGAVWGGIRDFIHPTQVFNPEKPESVLLMYVQP